MSCLVTMAVACLQTGCDNSRVESLSDGIYIEEASPQDGFAQQIRENYLIPTDNVTVPLTVRLVRPAERDVTVTISSAPDIVDAYNVKNSVDYHSLPDENWSMDSELLILKGSVSASANLTVHQIPNDGSLYALAIRINSVTGTEIRGNGSKMLYLFTAPLRQKAAVFSNTRDNGVPTATGFNKNLPQWTLEYWVRWDDNSKSNGAGKPDWTSSNAGNGQSPFGWRFFVYPPETQPVAGLNYQFLFYPLGGEAHGPNMQFKGTVGGNTNYYPGTGYDWSPDKWTHVAITFDGTFMRLFLNGETEGFREGYDAIDFTGKEAPTTWSNLKLAQYGNDAKRTDSFLKLEMAQVRLWEKALSQNEIKMNMKGSVRTDADGLVAYYKLDEGEGMVLHDSVKGGIDITCSNCLTWSDEYNFNNPNE